MAIAFLAAPRNIIFQAAKQHGQARATADGDHADSRAASSLTFLDGRWH
jgi:hypothetical protein